MHPEVGHIFVKRNAKDNLAGECEYHKDCLEGMVRISSLTKRCNLEDHNKIPSLPDNDPVWEIIGDYLAQLCLSLTLTVSPNVIVFGGGIMVKKKLLFSFFLFKNSPFYRTENA